jgi:hypothetical protein
MQKYNYWVHFVLPFCGVCLIYAVCMQWFKYSVQKKRVNICIFQMVSLCCFICRMSRHLKMSKAVMMQIRTWGGCRVSGKSYKVHLPWWKVTLLMELDTKFTRLVVILEYLGNPTKVICSISICKIHFWSAMYLAYGARYMFAGSRHLCIECLTQ